MLMALKENHQRVVYAGKPVNNISRLLHTIWGLRGKPKGEVTLTNKKSLYIGLRVILTMYGIYI